MRIALDPTQELLKIKNVQNWKILEKTKSVQFFLV